MERKGFSVSINVVLVFIVAALVMIAAVAILNGGLDNLMNFANQNAPAEPPQPFPS
jgi:hypothetical protein